MWRAAAVVTMFTLFAAGVPVAGAQQLPSLAHADLLPDSFELDAAAWPGQARQDQGSVAGAILLGSLLGVGGFVVGALVGSAVSDQCENADGLCIEDAAFFGAAGGGTLGMALGVHLGNHRQGNLALDFLTAAGIWGAGIFAASLAEGDKATLGILIALPIVQLGATVAVERASGG